MDPLGGAIANSSEAPLKISFKQHRTNAIAVAPRREVSINVTAKHITKTISKLQISSHRAVRARALALAIGIGIKYESASNISSTTACSVW